jgi:hypothetical protein
MSFSSLTSSIGSATSSSSDSSKDAGVIAYNATITAITGALGLIVGLALNEAFTAVLDKYWPKEKRGRITIRFVYAGVVLLILIAVILMFAFI